MDWQTAYEQDHTPWDLRGVTGPLKQLLRDGFVDRLGLPAEAEVAVPGCGRGHDLGEWARYGARVTGFDISPAAVAEAEDLARLNGCAVEVLCRDVLGLLPEFAERFDLVYDYTSYCAHPPHLRGAYLKQLAGLLRPGGHLLMLTFPLRPEKAGAAGRPPFLIEAGELRALAREAGLAFELSRDAEGSDPDRVGAERWFLWSLA